MIDREKAINELRFQLYSKGVKDEYYPVQLSASDATAILTLLKAQEAQGWVSVKDRLPEKSGEYLVITGSGNPNTLAYSTRHKAFNAYDLFDDARNKIKVSYWMPLPEPPKEEEEC